MDVLWQRLRFLELKHKKKEEGLEHVEKVQQQISYRTIVPEMQNLKPGPSVQMLSLVRNLQMLKDLKLVPDIYCCVYLIITCIKTKNILFKIFDMNEGDISDDERSKCET